MGLLSKAKQKLEDAAGGVHGERPQDQEGRQPNEARFEPEEARRRKKPGDALPQPEESKRGD